MSAFRDTGETFHELIAESVGRSLIPLTDARVAGTSCRWPDVAWGQACTALVATSLCSVVQIRDTELRKRALIATNQLNASLLFSCRFVGLYRRLSSLVGLPICTTKRAHAFWLLPLINDPASSPRVREL